MEVSTHLQKWQFRGACVKQWSRKFVTQSDTLIGPSSHRTRCGKVVHIAQQFLLIPAWYMDSAGLHSQHSLRSKSAWLPMNMKKTNHLLYYGPTVLLTRQLISSLKEILLRRSRAMEALPCLTQLPLLQLPSASDDFGCQTWFLSATSFKFCVSLKSRHPATRYSNISAHFHTMREE